MEKIIITTEHDLSQLIKATVSEAMAELKAFSFQQLGASHSKLLTVNESISLLRVSRCTFYNLIRENKIKSTRVGNRRLVSIESLNNFLNQ